jgi:hypothetical protein
VTALTKKPPIPGIAKIFSTTNDPVSSVASSGPKYVTTASSALRSTCRTWTQLSGTPLARAVLTKSSRATSTTELRVSWVT